MGRNQFAAYLQIQLVLPEKLGSRVLRLQRRGEEQHLQEGAKRGKRPGR